MADSVVIRHPETGGRSVVARRSLRIWLARGWEPTDEPIRPPKPPKPLAEPGEPDLDVDAVDDEPTPDPED